MQCSSCGSVACLGCDQKKEFENGIQRARWFDSVEEAISHMFEDYSEEDIYLMWHAGQILNKDYRIEE